MLHNTQKSGYFYLFPAFLVLALIILIPLLFGFVTSFMSWDWAAGEASKMSFIGLKNYNTMLHDKNFWLSIGRTIIITIIAIIVQFILGFSCALLLNQDIRFKWFFRTAFIFPLVVSDIVAALIWKMIFNPAWGPLNYYLGFLGLGSPNWLGDPSLVLPVAIIIDTWWQTGQLTIIFLAGLQGMDMEILEMSKVDGANYFQRLRLIIIPILKPVITVGLMFRSMDIIRIFAIIWGTTGGGPGRASEVAQLYIYREGVGRYLKMGYSATLSVTFTVIIIIVIMTFMKLIHRAEDKF